MFKRLAVFLHTLHHTVIVIHVSLALVEIVSHVTHMIPPGLVA